jgi:hypothetical protein
MTGAGAFGLGGRAARGSVAGAERAEAASGLPSRSVEAGGIPPNVRQILGDIQAREAEYNAKGIPAYHGTFADFDTFDKGKSQDFGVHFGTQDQASQRLSVIDEDQTGGRVIPARLQVKNPLDVRDVMNWAPQDLAGQLMQKGVQFTPEEIATLNTANRQASNAIIENALERSGYDALRYWNDYEGGGNSYAVWKPGSVKSATTGETLFSNPPSAAPAGLLATDQEHHSRSQPRNPSGQFVTPDSFDGKLHAFQKLIDTDGDGVPDTPAPSNAMAAMRRPEK